MNASTARAAHSNTGPIGLSAAARIRPLHRDEIELLPGLYSSWRVRNRERTIPHGIRMLEVAGNLDNVRRLAGESDAPFRGMLFADSDIYKTLEAVAWELGTAADDSLRDFYERTVSLLIRAQRDDGYLNSAFQDKGDPRRPVEQLRARARTRLPRALDSGSGCRKTCDQ